MNFNCPGMGFTFSKHFITVYKYLNILQTIYDLHTSPTTLKGNKIKITMLGDWITKVFHNYAVNSSYFASNYNRGRKCHGPDGCSSFVLFSKFQIQISAYRPAILTDFLWFS